MADAIEIIISAVDSASEIFQSIIGSANEMADSVSESVNEAGSTFDEITNNVSGFGDAVASIDNSTLEELGEELGMSAEEVQRLIESGADMGNLSAGFNEAAAAADELGQEIREDTDEMAEFGSAGDVMAANTFMDVANGMKDSMLSMADSAGTFQDSVMRAGLEAQGAGVSVEEMTSVVSELSETTGRAGGQIRESFIKAMARGVTDMDSFKTMMEGAGAQATLLGTDIQTMGDKFSNLAMKDTLMQKTLAETGITMNELADAMGITGATADEVMAKWKELDTNQRASVLGMAASMNEGKGANDEYKHSWAGLQEQLDIAKGRLERIVGSVILPVLIPAMKLAGDTLGAVGDVISGIMAGPLGGIVSIIATLGGAFIGAVAGAAALRNILAFLKIEMLLDTAATVMNTAAKILSGEASIGAAAGEAILSSSLMASASAAWAAAAGLWAAMAPLLPIIAAIALVVIAVYELGKAFEWWTDVSSMIDAIKSGIMRLWSAFINHPDVQAAISMISNALSTLWSWIQQAGQAVLEFFGIANAGDFDIVRAIIDGIGMAWDTLKQGFMAGANIITQVGAIFMAVWTAISGFVVPIINTIVTTVQSLVSVFTQFSQGQMSLPDLVISVLTILWNAYTTILNQIIQFVIKFASQMLQRALQAGRNFVNGILNQIRQLPGRVYTYLLQVVSRIVSAGQQWVSNARQKASDIVTGVVNILTGLPQQISNALSGVVDAIVGPFKQAYDTVVGIVDNIKQKVQEGLDGLGQLAQGGDAYGGDSPLAYGGDGDFNIYTGSYVNSNEPIEVEETITLILDFKNVPDDLDLNRFIDNLTNNEVLRALVEHPKFQSLDAKVKAKIEAKVRRSKGA